VYQPTFINRSIIFSQSSTGELIGSRNLVNIFVKSKNRGNFAALMNAQLFDKDTQKRSNVCGRSKDHTGKEKDKLDPTIIG